MCLPSPLLWNTHTSVQLQEKQKGELASDARPQCFFPCGKANEVVRVPSPIESPTPLCPFRAWSFMRPTIALSLHVRTIWSELGVPSTPPQIFEHTTQIFAWQILEPWCTTYGKFFHKFRCFLWLAHYFWRIPTF